MSEKQLRTTNVLLFLIFLILLINLAIDLIPYYLTGRMFGLFSSNNLFSGIELKGLDFGEIPLFINTP